MAEQEYEYKTDYRREKIPDVRPLDSHHPSNRTIDQLIENGANKWARKGWRVHSVVMDPDPKWQGVILLLERKLT